MKKALVLLVVALMASAALGQQMQFPVERDAGNDQNATHASAGAATTVRGAKNPWDEDTSYYDWNTEEIDNWINANGGRAMVAKVEFVLMPVTCPGVGTTVGIQVHSLQSQNDWVEGNGTSIWTNYNYSLGSTSSTYANAAEVWRWNDQGTPGDTSDDTKEVDPGLTLPWVDSGGISRSLGASQLRGLRNANDWDPGDVNAVYYPVDLDPAFWADLLDNPINRGIILWDENDIPGDENWQAYMREAGADKAAYIQVTMIPEPATMILLGLGGVAVLIRRKR